MSRCMNCMFLLLHDKVGARCEVDGEIFGSIHDLPEDFLCKYYFPEHKYIMLRKDGCPHEYIREQVLNGNKAKLVKML